MGGASLLENWILEGDEQGNIPENAFVFLSIVFGVIFFGAKLWVNDGVIPRKKKIILTNQTYRSLKFGVNFES